MKKVRKELNITHIDNGLYGSVTRIKSTASDFAYIHLNTFVWRTIINLVLRVRN